MFSAVLLIINILCVPALWTKHQALSRNRRMFYDAMTQALFTNLLTEWWHYDYGNKFRSFYTGEKAIYDCIFEL